MTYQIAIDGPSGAGKSTVAIAVAEKLGIDYIDTGAMYRAVALAIKRKGLKLEQHEEIKSLLNELDIDFKNSQVYLNGEPIDEQIRNNEIAKLASDASALPFVREKLVALQRELGSVKDVILDGRDIASNVFPNAKYKFFLNATPEERAKRRWMDLREKDPDIDYETVFIDIEKRDYNDTHRKLNPLVKVNGAIEIDTTGNTVEESARVVLEKIGEIDGDS